MTPAERLREPLALPCGAVLPNRLAKAAMTEGLAPGGIPGEDLIRLYRAWSKSGCGMLLTGNVQVDRDHLERPGNVVIDGEPSAALRAGLTAMACAAKEGGAAVWMQISHAGRQTPYRVNKTPKAPSAVPLPLPGKFWGDPVPLTEPEIERLIAAFANAARVARECSFDGVQIHGAHGYLISQFLSPRANVREDAWGGPLENRVRFLLETVKAVRAAVGPHCPVSVKLNSADFQKGAFDFEDSVKVAEWLAEAGVDLLEISGGTYEQPRMVGTDGLSAPDQPKRASTRAREAYFLDFAYAMLKAKTPPLMVTGGFRSLDSMAEALEHGISVVGVGRPLCADPEAVRALLDDGKPLGRWEDGLRVGPGFLSPTSGSPLIKALNALSAQSWFYQQLRHIGAGRTPKLKLGAFAAYLAEARDDAKINRTMRS